MKLYEAFLQEPTARNKTVSAISPANAWHQRVTLKDIVILKFGDGFILPVRYNTPALILQTDDVNILLGYYDPADKFSHKQRLVADGDMFLTCGKTRAVRMSDDGSLELLSMFIKEDGEIVSTPLVRYGADNELNIKLESLIVDMFGANAGGNIAWAQDKVLGFNTFYTNFKTNNKDLGPRIYHKIEGTPQGPAITYLWDITPVPVGAVTPVLLDTAGSPLNLKLSIAPSSPLELVLRAMAAPIFHVNLSPLGDLEIKHDISQAKIVMDATGQITIKSTLGLAEITMDPTGAVKIKGTTTVQLEGKAGIELKGVGVPVIQAIADFISKIYATHVHPTSMGPSGTPTNFSQAISSYAIGKFKKAKGGA